MKSINDIKNYYQTDQITKIYTNLRFWEYPRLARMEQMLPKKGKIIDLGCGIGIFPNYVAAKSKDRKVIGLEFSGKKIDIAKDVARRAGIKNVTFDSSDVTKAPLQDADAIVMMHVLHHLKSFKEQQRLLATCIGKLKKGGILMIDEVDKNYSFKHFLAFITDSLLYFGDTFYYRSQKDMINFLEKFPVTVEVKNVSNKIMPYPELVYICRKK